MTHLSVNLNKIALIRNSRGKDFPQVEAFGLLALNAGVHGLTVHPRPDERHARFSDLPKLKKLVEEERKRRHEVEFNVEGYPSPAFLQKVIEVHPDQCTLVPDAPDAITSNAGWDFKAHEDFLSETCKKLKAAKIRVSLFLDPFSLSNEQLTSLKKIAPERIEFYTEQYAVDFDTRRAQETLAIYKGAAEEIKDLGIEINAGHDLNQKNLKPLIDEIPAIKEVSIGHALIVESILDGFENTLKNYLKILGFL